MLFDQFFINGPIPANAMHGYYNMNLVALSYLAAFLGSYIALDMTGRMIAESSKHGKTYWLIASAFILGCSIWSMHFIGMQAYILPMPMSYDPFWTFFSLIVAIFGSFCAFTFIKSESTSIFMMILSGIVMGLCIASMHYVGMEAMETELLLGLFYIPWIFFLSIAIAIIVSIIAIWLLIKSNQGSISRQFQFKILSALVMAAAICCMHYTGMTAAVFIPKHIEYSVNTTIFSQTLVYYIFAILGLMFFISLVISTQRQLIINQMKQTQAYKLQIKLEKKVHDRTLELKTKNLELSETLEKLRIMQDNLVYAEKMATIGQLSAGVSHEINNPLSYILSNMSFLQKYHAILTKLIEIYHAFLDELNNNSNYHKSELHNQIELYTQENKISRMMEEMSEVITESKEGLLKIKTVVTNLSSLSGTISELNHIDVNAAIQDSIHITWNELKYKCNIHKNFTDLPFIEGSLKQFELMMVNLLLNAAQAIQQQGDVTISTSVEDSNILISVADTGCGIPVENIPKLFTPFFTTKPIGSATGLGLATVSSVVKSFGGKIKVESEIGKGSIFIIYLPVNANG